MLWPGAWCTPALAAPILGLDADDGARKRPGWTGGRALLDAEMETAPLLVLAGPYALRPVAFDGEGIGVCARLDSAEKVGVLDEEFARESWRPQWLGLAAALADALPAPEAPSLFRGTAPESCSSNNVRAPPAEGSVAEERRGWICHSPSAMPISCAVYADALPLLAAPAPALTGPKPPLLPALPPVRMGGSSMFDGLSEVLGTKVDTLKRCGGCHLPPSFSLSEFEAELDTEN